MILRGSAAAPLQGFNRAQQIRFAFVEVPNVGVIQPAQRAKQVAQFKVVGRWCRLEISKRAMKQRSRLLILAPERRYVAKHSQTASRLRRFSSKELFLECQRFLPDQ